MIKLSYEGEDTISFLRKIVTNHKDDSMRVYVDMLKEGDRWIMVSSSLEEVGYIPHKPFYLGGKSILQRLQYGLYEPLSIDIVMFI